MVHQCAQGLRTTARYNAAQNVPLDFQLKSSSCHEDSNPLQIPLSTAQGATSALVTANVEGCEALRTNVAARGRNKNIQSATAQPIEGFARYQLHSSADVEGEAGVGCLGRSLGDM